MHRRPPAANSSSDIPPGSASGRRPRVEPTLDRDAEFGEPSPPPGDRPPPPPPRARRQAWWWSGAAALLIIAGLLLWFREPLSERLWPETRAQQLRADAALALQRGQLSAADGSGARELYEAALALDPDRLETRAGLAQVGQAALERARVAIAENRHADAEDALALARQLTVPAAQADALAAQLRDRQVDAAGINRLLAFAAAAREAGRLDGSDNAALPLYQRVLTLQPNHKEALEGREDTLSDLLQQAQRTLARGDLVVAALAVERVQRADSGHVELPDVLAELASAIEQRRREADAALDRDRLPNALEGYRQVLGADPDDAGAVQGLIRVGRAYAQRSGRLAADFRFDQAEAALREARAVGESTRAVVPEIAQGISPAIAEGESNLARARQSQARLGRADAGPGRAAERRARLHALLAEADAAEGRGDLLAPPGESAFDKLRAARALAPQDPVVQAAAARLLPAARTCFEDELRGNRLARAGACLDARVVLGDGAAAVRGARQRLAQRWIAIGEQRLGAGEVAAATAALASARALDPAVAGIDALAERVSAAAAAAD
ncbi:hypothetical protein [Lysobacter sp. D1-1-M9]|uniref:hypothetical protein n=1 Tax=Novilysobacter longmucuonensis TaxID=3098603 RepID=UPI0039832259